MKACIVALGVFTLCLFAKAVFGLKIWVREKGKVTKKKSWEDQTAKSIFDGPSKNCAIMCI